MKKNVVILVSALLAIAFMTYMLLSIGARKEEQAILNTAPVIVAEGVESRNDLWQSDYPRQYDTWKKTKENPKIDDLLEKYPQLVILWAGYGFAKDYNAPRGHLYAFHFINTGTADYSQNHRFLFFHHSFLSRRQGCFRPGGNAQ